MPLSKQEKLALIMTSAGSMRNAAALIGITHQKLGRWLREGEQGGVSQIPDHPAISAAIDNAFDIHKDITRDQARIDGTPFFAKAPVYVERRLLRKTDSEGNRILGDRVISGPTEFIRQDMRDAWITDVVKSQKFYKVNVRSLVNLQVYFGDRAIEEINWKRRRNITAKRLASIMIKQFLEREKSERGRIINAQIPFALYTQSESTMPGSEPWRVVAGVEDLLARKHSPAASEPGTKFADEYLLQLIPESYVPAPRKQRRGTPVRKGRRIK